jgi:1-acyl-sn-glycerol-3-phosphate acyltransferase
MKEQITHFLNFLYRPVFIVQLGVNTALLGTLVILISFFDPTGNRVYKVGRFWSKLNLFLAGIRVKVTGYENVDPDQSYILMTNHQSHLDVWAICHLTLLQLRWVMKMELRKIPVFGLACERMGQIYIDRSDSEKAHQSLENARVKIRNGASVVFFPEGTRSPDGKLLPFKKGGFVMALKTGTPILPMTITGSRNLLPKRSMRIRPGHIKVQIHKPVSVESYTMEAKEELLAAVKDIIAGGLYSK